MRCLFRDEIDNTLLAAEIAVVGYDPELNELWFNAIDGSCISIFNINRTIADSSILDLYLNQHHDFSSYDAHIERDCEEE